MSPRIAVNPIPYWARDGVVDKSREVFDEAFADFRRIGFTAVKADLPEGMRAAEYREWIGSYGLAPAISTLVTPFTEESSGLTGGAIEALQRFAADQLALDNAATMLIAPMTPARLASPGVGIDATDAQLAHTTEHLGLVCDVLLAEGVFPGLHQHVGGLVETEAETRHVLDALGPDRLGFAPDSGHMAWAGMDPAAMVVAYGERIVGVHVKDVFADHLPATGELGYHEVGATKRLWAEPGRGVVDLLGFVAALPQGYDGDLMIEVDVPSVESRYESHRISYEWARAALAPASDATV